MFSLLIYIIILLVDVHCQEGESMNRGIVWTFTLVIVLDYIQM
jgi:hypothetical protein